MYLPEEQNGKKLHQLYMEKYSVHLVSYESYLRIFYSEFNVSYGYPRSDTCSEGPEDPNIGRGATDQGCIEEQ